MRREFELNSKLNCDTSTSLRRIWPPYILVRIGSNIRNTSGLLSTESEVRYRKLIATWHFYIVKLVGLFGKGSTYRQGLHTQLSIHSDKRSEGTILNPLRKFYFEPRFTCQNFRWYYLISYLFSNQFGALPLQGVVFLSISDLTDTALDFSVILLLGSKEIWYAGFAYPSFFTLLSFILRLWCPRRNLRFSEHVSLCVKLIHHCLHPSR